MIVLGGRGHEVAPLEGGQVEPEGACGGQERPARGMRIRARERRQARDRATGAAAVVVPREPDPHAQERRLRRPVAARKAHDRLRREPRGGGDPLRVVLLDVLRERAVAERGTVDILVVHQALFDEHVHHPQRQRAVRARPRLEIEVRRLRGLRPVGIDAHDEGAALPRPLHERHEVDVRVARVDAPQDNQVGTDHLLGVAAGDSAERGRPSGVRGRDADRAVELRGAQRVEERVTGPVLEEPQRAAVGKRQDGFPAPLRDHAPPPARDQVDRGIPADGLETPLALGPDAPERRQHSRRGVDPLGVVVDFAADHAAREGVRGVAADVGDAPVVHGDDKSALGRAIVGANRLPNLMHDATG
ncbi:MAG: hypothetical protein HW381_1889 [Candidatus Rokubacteria bacterium]|nr:hypothetical protein [Candidatus Rokubacteria bacterium]